MNNQDFRRLVGDTPRQQHGNSSPATSKTPNVSLGSRQKSSIPMTPRTVGGTNNSSSFARQLAEQRNETQSARKFKAMAAPRGVKLAKGYQDRASARAATNEDEREERIRALEEQMKLGQIEKSAFVQMRDEITGGDVGATHLVKGLDMKLLERVRKGEDVFAPNRPAHGDSVPSEEEKMGDDAELDQLEQKEVTAVEREKIHKKGEMAPPPLAPSVAGVKRSRNDILAELKAHRQAASEAKAASAAQPRSNFKRFGEQKQASSRIERDEKGREVLITVDENGRVKRKVRKVAATAEQPKRAMPMPDPKVKPLGMEAPQLPLPAPASTPIEDEDDDIFEGVGDSTPLYLRLSSEQQH
ncbi:hypothetical protein FH972_023051 [Carpinus fangiana]|uniref:RED-like N-terminal domain-containing protein n=1 Tax=Carpinus fangiana TaxID=176857 RepID=A0A5N6KUN3_9ROSI|nr:hypothetical protein FH972_023051 [Carpinus fangiana]